MRVEGRIPGRRGLWELAWEEGRVASLSALDPAYEETRTRWITPGLFDLQVNGIGGINFTSSAVTVDDLARADSLLRARGVARWCPTIITCASETACAAIDTFGVAWKRGVLPGAWGLHFEGPWISPEEGFRGVHRLEFIRDPDIGALDALRVRAADRLRILTVAPERAGAVDLIRHAASNGIVVCLGHTNASPVDVAAAVRAGARASTHLFNGCARLVDRHRNPIYSQLSEDGLFACFIADGHHVPFSTLRIGLRAKGTARSALVSDIAYLSGLPDGEYVMEGNTVELKDGGLWVKGSWMLSGAVRTLDQDVELLARESEPGIEHALLMATRNPAVIAGDPAWSELEPGRPGPVAVFAWDGRRLSLEERLGF
jgi:N-acetylglucosamine-6-phosphate deacetylase